MNTSATTNINNKINISNNNAINDKNNTNCPSSGGGGGGGMLSTCPRRGTKHKSLTGSPPVVRKRRKLQHSSKSGESRLEQVPQTKNTVAVLNELKRNLVYKVESQTGPVHAPLFTISVVVDGQKFIGTGPSKKLARVAAAASALRSFIQFKDGATLTPIEPLQNVDFTSDDPMIENTIFPLSDAVPGIQEKIISSSGKPLPDNVTVNSNNNNSLHNNNKSSYNSSNNSSCSKSNSSKQITTTTNNNRLCDFAGNTVPHSISNNSNNVIVSNNGNNNRKHRKEAGMLSASVHSAITDIERLTTTMTTMTTTTMTTTTTTMEKQTAIAVNNINQSSVHRTATAAASSIVTNIGATGTTCNDSYEQYISVSTGHSVTTVTAASTGTALKNCTVANIIPVDTAPIIPKNKTIQNTTLKAKQQQITQNNPNTNTATAIVMVPLTVPTSEQIPAFLSTPSVQTCRAQKSKNSPPNEITTFPAKKPSKLKTSSRAVTSITPSATEEFNRFVNYIQCDSFALKHSKKHPCHGSYFNKFASFDTPINSYVSLVRDDLSNVTSSDFTSGKASFSKSAIMGKSLKSACDPDTVPEYHPSIHNATHNAPATAIVIVTSPTSVITSSNTTRSESESDHSTYIQENSNRNTVNSYTFHRPTTINNHLPSTLLDPYAQNGHRQVVEKIQQSLNLFKNTNEKAVAWKKRFEKLKISSGNALRNSSGNVVSSGHHHPKPQPEKGPVMLLHELFTDAHFECVSSDGLQHSKFTVVVTVNDNQRFEGTGPSKKMAKNAAAKAALASICNISFSPLQQSKFGLISASGASNGSVLGGPNSVQQLNGDTSFTQNKNFELPQTFADAVGKLVIDKFNEVMKGSDVYSRRKVLAGFVMTYGYDVKTARVISLATGTKCVSGEHMSVTGSVINDSHAEIIARRGLMDFFYSQLDLLCVKSTSTSSPQTDAGPGLTTSEEMGMVSQTGSLNGSNGTLADSSCTTSQFDSRHDDIEPAKKDQHTRHSEQQDLIFNKPSDGLNLYTLKEGIYFHLYINTAPCGDARVFSPHENDSMDVDKHPNRKARGQLRTKVESGEGTIPVKSSDGIQTWDGVLQGQRLLTMSCSDKISRWNVLGLQGSLLASIIEPIYLHSIVLGSLLHPAHMYRAICGRIECAIQGLPPPYRLNKPKLALMTSAESRNQTKPPNFSINWITNGTEVEIVNSFTGKLINNNTNTNKMSRLSKQSFYQRYSTIVARLPCMPFREVKPTYFETKMSVVEYQQAKRELFAAFSKEDLGEWLKKPIEQDQFTLIASTTTITISKDSESSHVAQQQSPQQAVPMPPELISVVSNACHHSNSSGGNGSK